MTSAASRRAFEAFCSPSAAITLARASRAASASAAIARCSCTGSRTSLLQVGVHIEARSANPLEGNLGIIKIWTFTHISTLSTLTPHGSVASSRVCSMTWLIVSRSDRISARFLVPSTFLSVVAAKSLVEWLQSTNGISFVEDVHDQRDRQTQVCRPRRRAAAAAEILLIFFHTMM